MAQSGGGSAGLWATLVRLATSAGASLVGFIHSGAGMVARTMQSKARDSVNALDAGVVQDGVADNSVSLQQLLNNGPFYQFDLSPNVALFNADLTWTHHNFGVRGLSPAVRGGAGGGGGSDAVDYGPTLKYTGAGNALTVGVDPGGAGTFIFDPQIENIRLRVAVLTAIALRVWMAAGARIKNVHIFGSSGAGVGISLEGCIDTVLEGCDVQGYMGAGGVVANQLSEGLHIKTALGTFGASICTTIRVRNCYFHYCVMGANCNSDDSTIFEDTIFEANVLGVAVAQHSQTTLKNCWFEGNDTNIYFAAASKTLMDGGILNSYTRQIFCDGAVPDLVSLRNVALATSHAAPLLFNPVGGSLAGMRLVIDNCSLPANFTINGGGYPSPNGINWKNVEVVGMRQVVYRFRKAAVAANVAYFMPQDNGSAYPFLMPEKGHILASHTYYVGAAITAGAFDTGVLKNGASVVSMVGAASAATPLEVNGIHYRDKFAAGDTLQAYVHTNAAFLAVGGEFITEILVAFGNDGM